MNHNGQNYFSKKFNDIPPEDIYIHELPEQYEMSKEDEIICKYLASEILELFEGYKVVIAYESMRQVCEYIENFEDENDLD